MRTNDARKALDAMSGPHDRIIIEYRPEFGKFDGKMWAVTICYANTGHVMELGRYRCRASAATSARQQAKPLGISVRYAKERCLCDTCAARRIRR